MKGKYLMKEKKLYSFDCFISVLLLPFQFLIMLLAILVHGWDEIKNVYREYIILPIFTGKKIRAIEVKDNDIFLKIGSKFTEKIPLRCVENIYYSIDINNSETYFYVKTFKNNCKQRFGREYCIKYHIGDIDKFFNKMKESNIKVNPYFDGGLTLCRGNIYKFCKKKNKYLLTLAGNTDTVCFEDNKNQVQCFHVPLKNLNIYQAMNNPNVYFKDKPKVSNYYFDNVIYILDETLSLNRGYVLIPEKDINIIEENIKYVKDFNSLIKTCEDIFFG